MAGAWALLRPGEPESGAASGRGESLPRQKRDPEPSRAAVVKLRPVTGDQLCAAIPDGLRKSLVADGRYGGKDTSTAAAAEDDKRAACSWRNNKMDVGGGVLGYRMLSVSVQARSSERQNAVEYAREQFARDKERHEKRVNAQDGKRVDGRTTGSAFDELLELKYGDESYNQSSIGHSGLKAVVRVRQGPWLIQVEYGGSNRTGAKYPGGDETRAAAGNVAERVAAELAKDADEVKITGPCGILAVKDVEAAFFPAVSGPSVSGDDGRIKQTGCTWDIREAVEREPVQEFTARGGRLVARVIDWGSDGLGSRFQYDRDARKFDRYHAKGGIGDKLTHTTFEAREELSGLGEKAFAVVSTISRPNSDDDKVSHEILINVLSGERTVEFTYRGTTAGGGVVGAPGYREPVFEAAVAKKALLEVAGTFLAGLK